MAEHEVEDGWRGSPVADSPGGGALQWVTVDGPLGVQQEEALKLARNFFYAGFCLLPWLWFVNCFYFWPVLRHREADSLIRPYVLWSGVGCLTMTSVLLAWSLTFAIGGENIFGSAWKHFAVYDIADKYSMVQVPAWNLQHGRKVAVLGQGIPLNFAASGNTSCKPTSPCHQKVIVGELHI